MTSSDLFAKYWDIILITADKYEHISRRCGDIKDLIKLIDQDINTARNLLTYGIFNMEEKRKLIEKIDFMQKRKDSYSVIRKQMLKDVGLYLG